MEQNGGEFINWVTSALVNLCVKERPARPPFILSSSLLFVLHSPRLVLIKVSPPWRYPGATFTFAGSTDISSPFLRLAFATIVRIRIRGPVWLTVTGFRGVHACTASSLSSAREARVSVNLLPRWKRYVHRSRAMFLLILHVSRVKGACNSVSWNFRGIFEGRPR